MEEAFEFYDESKRGYITFLNLRKILEKMKVKLRNELIEYLIYLLKTYNDENSSITELKYENLIKILNDENYGKPDELDLEEEENEQAKKTKRDPNAESDEDIPHHPNNDSDESGIEITTEEYLKIVEGILIELTNKLYQKRLTLEELFKEFVSVVENKEKKSKNKILDLKYLVNILHDELEINLDSVDIYCLFTKFKVDENETEEVIDFVKFQAEINQMISDPNAFYLKIQMDKEENKFKKFNDKNNLENLKQQKNNNINNNLDTFVNMNNANIMTSTPLNTNKNPINDNNNLKAKNFEMQMKMNSLDYLRTFLRENKIEFENLIQPLTEHFKKNSFSGDIYIDLNLFDEYLESKNLFSKTEFIENLPEIFANESIRMALLTKDNKLNLSFLKQILDECEQQEQMIDYSALPVGSDNIQHVHVEEVPIIKKYLLFKLFLFILISLLFKSVFFIKLIFSF